MAPVRVVVVGGGSWGTCFACLLRDRGHEVTLACRDPEEVRAITATGRNPRYLTDADLRGVSAATIGEAPIAESELVALAVPRRAPAEGGGWLPGAAPALTPTKGRDPGPGGPAWAISWSRAAACTGATAGPAS